MKTNLISVEGRKLKEIELPKCFSQPIREDIIFKVLEAKKSKQPYAPSLIAGKQHSASGKIKHRRHVWKTHYGYGISRIPRKIMSRRGSRFNWTGAEIASTVGGRRAHPPKVVAMINTKKINKKEQKFALASALSATASEEYVKKKYKTLKNEKIKIPKLPFVVESNITKLKTKQLLNSLRKIFGDLSDIAISKKSVRAGKGKMRGRKYKKTSGALVVVSKDEKLKVSGIDVKNVKNISVIDLAKGGPGRLVIYTENAIKNIDNKFKDEDFKNKKEKFKEKIE